MNNQATATSPETDEIRRSLLSYTQVQHYKQRILDLQEAAMGLEMAGTAEAVSIAIGNFHLYKGKIETFEELLADHLAASEQLQAAQH